VFVNASDIAFINATPDLNPVFRNAVTDSAYVPRGLDPVVANVINNSPFGGSEGNSSGLIKPRGSAKLLSIPLKDFGSTT
tara:strand:- start:68 stop:307 length:240 start_codon:yes stop_codon:yes gene_type:complete